MLFSNKRAKDGENIKIVDVSIEWSKNVKYLGVMIYKRLICTTHLNTTISKAKGTKFVLFLLINKRSSLSTRTKMCIYKMCIRQIITYAAPAWTANLLKSTRQNLKLFN